MSIKRLPHVRPGDSLRAKRWNDMIRAVNANSRRLAFFPPNFFEDMARPPAMGLPATMTLTETPATRTTATQDTIDDGGDTHQDNIATQLTFTDQSGRTWILNIVAPS